jgi:hypothetical protein
MNYDLEKSSHPQRTVQGKIEYSLDQAMPYGDSAPSMLMSKFEETDIGGDEDEYDNYARDVLVDQRPDTNKFEHEEARGGVNRRAGRLELQYYGHRGSVDTPYRPEIFDDFMGPEDRDPRGINVDPDFKELRRQHAARTRFIRWAADGSDHITGGTRAERKIVADQQQLFRIARDRLKVFSRQLDGQRNPLRREYKHKSEIPKQILVQSYGDYIKDYALTPQRRANIICREILTNIRAWRDETMDADFAFARYAQLCRRARSTGGKVSRTVDDRDGRLAAGGEDQSKHFKAIGILMSNIVKGKQQTLANARDVDLEESHTTAARKTEPFVRDLTHILRSLEPTSDFSAETTTRVGRVSVPQNFEHLSRLVLCNHSIPAHHYINAEIIYKSVYQGHDLRSIGNLVVTDAREATNLRAEGQIFKSAARGQWVGGAKLNTDNDTIKGESSRTVNYRAILHPNGDKRIRLFDKSATKFDESDPTPTRRLDHTNYKTHAVGDTENDVRYGTNAYKDRHGRGLGSKYMTRFIERDARGDEISAGN